MNEMQNSFPDGWIGLNLDESKVLSFFDFLLIAKYVITMDSWYNYKNALN